MWKLKRNAHRAREMLRQGERLCRKRDKDQISWDSLSTRQQHLVDGTINRELHVAVDKANKPYGHGIARTHDYGFRPGENICRDVPIEVRARRRIC